MKMTNATIVLLVLGTLAFSQDAATIREDTSGSEHAIGSSPHIAAPLAKHSKPIAITIIGGVLTGDGIVSLGAGIPLLIMSSKQPIPADLGTAMWQLIFLFIGIGSTAEGIGTIIPGTILLNKAGHEWDIYNKQQEQPNAGVSISMTFAFGNNTKH